MTRKYKAIIAALGAVFATQAAAEIVFYNNEGFQGRSFTAQKNLNDFERQGFNDRASSAIVFSDRWEVCEHARFEGRCRILRPGRYPSLDAMGMGDQISSVRKVSGNTRYEESRYAPQPYPAYDARRRNGERVFSADVTAVRAVYAQPEQRCWTERETVGNGNRGDPNVGGAIAGAVLGGILGHQVGSGRGNDVATALGAVGGAAVGSQVGRGGNGSYTQDVRRCSTTPTSGRPDYYDVTYVFKGQEHRMQTAAPPGPTVAVNGRGEPRV